MIATSEIVAAVLYLLPVLLWVAWHSSRSVPGSCPAIEIAAAMAVDLLSVLLLARIMRLEWATLVSRTAWALVGATVGVRRWRAGARPRWPSAPEWRVVAQLVLVVLAAVWLSLRLSRPCAIWDRDWHIPLVTALRGQRLPFMNVYDMHGGLFYHFAGDVQAAMLQTLSGERLHASLALSLAHDVMFALIGLNVVWFLRQLGVRRLALALLVFAAVVMTGPVTLLRDPNRKLETGFAIVNFLTLSFRPHCALAYLLELGFLQCVVTGLNSGEAQPVSGQRRRLAVMAALAGALVLTDEASLGMLGLALGAVWLVYPKALAPNRRAGLLAFGVLLAAIVTSAVLFVGSVGRSAPHLALTLVAPRAPGFAGPSLSLATKDGRAVLLQDLLPVLGVLLAVVLLAWRTRGPAVRGLAVFYAALAIPSILALTCLDFEHRPSESHRFVTALFILGPVLALIAFERAARVAGATVGGVPALVACISLGLGMASTLEWLDSGVALRQAGLRGFYGWSADRFYDVDCRRETGARVGEKTTPTYVDRPGFYLWSGCHPVFAPSTPIAPGEHQVKIGTPIYGRPAIERFHNQLANPADWIEVVCLTGPGTGANADPACKQVLAKNGRTGRGASFTSVTVDGAERERLLRAL